MADALKKTRIELNNAVFSLPDIVAKSEGYFEQEGLDVELVVPEKRKAKMADLSDAFIGLPGGYGTLDEMFEALTWSQLGYHAKPCGLLNVGRYFARLADYLDHAVTERFLAREHRDMLLIEDDPDVLITRLQNAPLPQVTTWIGRGET